MKKFLILVTLFLLGACGTINGANYASSGADFDLFQFFEGDVKAYGIVQDRDGDVVQRFEVDIIGTVKDGTLTLDETFTYSIGDGVKKRLWTIKDEGNARFSGGAADILGSATGQDFGNAFYWGYKMDLPVGNTSYEVSFKDWMWAFDQGHIINRSYIKKFGITFAEVTMFMEKR